MSYLVWKKSLPGKILSSFSLTAQRHKNIANRNDYQIDDTDKRAYSHMHSPQSCWLIMDMAFQIWCLCHKFSIFLTNYFTIVFISCGKWLGWNIQVVRTSSPGPSLVNSSLPSQPPGLVPKSPWRNSSTATVEEFYYSFYYN